MAKTMNDKTMSSKNAQKKKTPAVIQCVFCGIMYDRDKPHRCGGEGKTSTDILGDGPVNSW